MDDATLFDQIRNLLNLHPHTITEICNRLDKNHREVLEILVSNPYSFDFKMNRGSKTWTTFEKP